MADSSALAILFLGDTDVGKSTFFSTISSGIPSPNGAKLPSPPLLKDANQPFVFGVQKGKRGYRLELYDTSCQETSWRQLKPDAIVLCYDISARQSLINLPRVWLKSIHAIIQSNRENYDIPVMMLGLKRDLRSETDPNGIIYPQEAYRIAQEMRCDKYMECSAVTGELLAQSWEDICDTAIKTRSDGRGLSQGGCKII